MEINIYIDFFYLIASFIADVASWREMVREAIGDDVKLQKELLLMLINANDAQEGLYWAKEYKIPRQEWPWMIVHAEEEEESAQGIAL